MPGKKQKKAEPTEGPEALQRIFEEISECLATVKPHLARVSELETESIIDDMHRIAKLAESFTKTKSSGLDPPENASTMLDQLDLEGVGLWNSATHLRANESSSPEIFAAVRYAGFRLIEAGLDANPSEEAILKLLELSSKVGMSYATVESSLAEEILTNAASYEHSIRSLPSTDDAALSRKRARAIVLYYTSRMDAAWKQHNDDVSYYMLEKIQDHQVQMLPIQDLEVVVDKIVAIGKSVLKGKESDTETTAGKEGNEIERATRSLTWLQRAFTFVDKRTKDSKSIVPTKRMVLRSLARAYYISSANIPANLDRAEAALKELSTSIEESGDEATSECQQLRWMHLAVLKRRKADDEELLSVLLSLIDNIELAEEPIQDILLELRVVSRNHFDVVTQALERLIARTIDEPQGHEMADKMLISLIMHMKDAQRHEEAVESVRKACNLVAAHEAYQLEELPVKACLTLLWQLGDTQYHSKHWVEAADWFLIGTNKAFASFNDTGGTKCLRKAALCYIQNQQYHEALHLIKRCPSHEASTCYLSFLVAASQGQLDEAVLSIQRLIKSADFDRKMLFLATDFAREAKNRPLLHAVLKALLDTVQNSRDIESDTQGITLIRCMIRLVLQMIEEPAADLKKLVPILMDHFRTGYALALDASKRNTASAMSKDISWLWRTAYNSAITGLGIWQDSDVTTTFLLARNLMEVASGVPMAELEQELLEYRMMASFAVISGQIFALKARADLADKSDAMRRTTDDIDQLLRLVQSLRSKKDNSENIVAKLDGITHLSFLYQAEIYVDCKDWERLSSCINIIGKNSEISMITHEAIADILWSNKECPISVICAMLETTIRSLTRQKTIPLKRLSRWIRAICSILLSSGRAPDRGKALAYMHQAADILKEGTGSEDPESELCYPIDEKSWLISTAFNNGVECISAMDVQDSQQWFEIATVLCRFVEDSPRQKIEATYREMLSRYAGGK